MRHHELAAMKRGSPGILAAIRNGSPSPFVWFAARMIGRWSGNRDMPVMSTRR